MKCMHVFPAPAGLVATLFVAALCFGAGDNQGSKKEREILDNLIAPCCWSQPVSQHYSKEAEQVRQEVHAMVADGKSRDEILNYYVARYGERILASPRARGFNVLAYVLPWTALILGAWFLLILLKKLRRPAAAPTPSPLPNARYASVIEKEMKDLEE